jgi:apolipoprotein D and lipocalin family protein
MKMVNIVKRLILALVVGIAALFTGCASLPDGIEPVADFDLDGYLGKWYELARLDHRFERNLEQVTACVRMAASK